MLKSHRITWKTRLTLIKRHDIGLKFMRMVTRSLLRCQMKIRSDYIRLLLFPCCCDLGLVLYQNILFYL